MTIDRDFGVFSDLYKDTHGIRPRHLDVSDWSEGDFDREFAALEVAFEESQEAEATQYAAALVTYEARLAQICKDFGVSRSDAFRWDMGAERTYSSNDQEVEQYLWNQRLGWDDIGRIQKEILKG
tara:strand:- start:581 stop:955 length:375 start_codon:yes stop_codon:yes gene_type:complete